MTALNEQGIKKRYGLDKIMTSDDLDRIIDNIHKKIDDYTKKYGEYSPKIKKEIHYFLDNFDKIAAKAESFKVYDTAIAFARGMKVHCKMVFNEILSLNLPDVDKCYFVNKKGD